MKLKEMMMAATIFVGLPLTETWNPDTANAKIGFSVKGPFGTVHGTFTGLKATIKFDEKDLPGSSVTASVDAKTVSSGVGMRNSHLRNEEQWLNTDKFPTISYKSKKIEKTDKGFKSIGDLTLKGTTKPVDIPFTFSPAGSNGVFKGEFTIKRTDYKLGKSGGSVGEDITITLDVPVKK